MQLLARAVKLSLAFAVGIAAILCTVLPTAVVRAAGPEAPRFEVDPMWPQASAQSLGPGKYCGGGR